MNKNLKVRYETDTRGAKWRVMTIPGQGELWSTTTNYPFGVFIPQDTPRLHCDNGKPYESAALREKLEREAPVCESCKHDHVEWLDAPCKGCHGGDKWESNQPEQEVQGECVVLSLAEAQEISSWLDKAHIDCGQSGYMDSPEHRRRIRLKEILATTKQGED